MSVTITASPLLPLVDKGAKLAFVLRGGGNYVRLWCTAAPLDSKLRTQLNEDSSSRVEIFAGDATPTSVPFLFQPDAPGKYTIVAQEYTKGASSYGGGYAGDPQGFLSETKQGGETSTAVDFGERVTFTLSTGGCTAT